MIFYFCEDSILSYNMRNRENFSGSNLGEQLSKMLQSEELAYPLRLVDLRLRSFDFRHLGTKLHYWDIIQIHELLDDSNVLPKYFDDNTWYQYISAYLILPKMEQLIEINRFVWDVKIEFVNDVIIKEAIKDSLEMLVSRTLINKVKKPTTSEPSNSPFEDQFNTVLSRKELSYSVNLLEIGLRKLRIKVQYSNIMKMHEFLKYGSILADEYDYNLWYRYIAAYIIATYLDVNKLIELNTSPWSDWLKKKNEEFVLDFKSWLGVRSIFR
jgi:hypothetical protein